MPTEYTEISSPSVLERLRGLVEGLTRPRTLLMGNCVTPVVEVGGFSGVVKTLLGTISSPSASAHNQVLVNALTGYQPGRQYKILNITLALSTLGTSITMSGVGYSKNSPVGGTTVVSIVGNVNNAQTAATAALSQAFGGDLVQPVILDGKDAITAWVAAVNNTAANTLIFFVTAIELAVAQVG